jgi:hypothetical protein
MNINDDVIREWFYRLPKGYAEAPYTESELSVLADVIAEHDAIIKKVIPEAVELVTEESEVDDLADLFNALQGLPKRGQFDILAKYTANHYSNHLGQIAKLFPEGSNVIDNYKDYLDPEKSYRNEGEAKEAAIAAWATENNVPATHLEGSTGKGVDIILDGKPIEVKSSKTDINVLLQTSFFKKEPTKFYIFATSQGGDAIKMVIVSSQLLYRLSLGEDIYNELSTGSSSEKLSAQITDGLKDVDFASQIAAALTTGEAPAGAKKSFKLGKNIRIRFLVFIEPTGKFD